MLDSMTPISSGSEAPLQTIRFTTVFSIRLSGLNSTTKAVGGGRGRGGRGGRDRGNRPSRDDDGPRGGLDHIHSITRSPNGKDYGIFALNHGPKTLLEHYALEDHHKMSNTLFDYSIASLQDTENMEMH